jgi:hypothetical protein
VLFGGDEMMRICLVMARGVGEYYVRVWGNPVNSLHSRMSIRSLFGAFCRRWQAQKYGTSTNDSTVA